MEKILREHRRGYKVVLDADVKGFFDNIPHALIIDAIAQEVADGNILRLIEKLLSAGVMEDGVFKPTTIGTPQGGVFSPLAANMVLNKLDWALEKAGFRFVRYADDFVVACQTHSQAEEALVLVREVLEGELALELHPDKTVITPLKKGYEFLGFKLGSRTRSMRPKAAEKFKEEGTEYYHKAS